MRRIALTALFHDRSRMIAAVVGVMFAAILMFSQLGLYAGLLSTSTEVVRRMGGDVWVFARGTEVLDRAEWLSPGSRAAADAHPCTASVRSLVYERIAVRKPGGALAFARLAGVPRAEARSAMPWNAVAGLPQDLATHMRVSVDALDLRKLGLPRAPLGARLEIAGESVQVAVVSHGVRSFDLLPVLFADADTARQVARMPAAAATFWVVDATQPGCVPSLIAGINAVEGLEALRRDELIARTEAYYVNASGMGAILGFVAFLGLVVGTVVVGQTLYGMTRDHQRELATLKALGARGRELVGFVAWQAGLLTVIGVVAGYAVTLPIRSIASDAGLSIVLSPWVVGSSTAAVVAVCAVSSALAMRKVTRLDAGTVFA